MHRPDSQLRIDCLPTLSLFEVQSVNVFFYYNIRLLSDVRLRGRRRACGERISLRDLFVDLLMGLFSLALFYRFGTSFAFFTSFVFMALVVISFIDLDVRIVPDVISLTGIVMGLIPT